MCGARPTARTRSPGASEGVKWPSSRGPGTRDTVQRVWSRMASAGDVLAVRVLSPARSRPANKCCRSSQSKVSETPTRGVH